MILCCGEMLIDMIPEETLSGTQGFVPHSGGAIYNTAIALGRLGTPVGMLGGQSTDMFGAQLRAGLEASHVDTTRVVVSDRPTTLAFVQMTNGQARYSFVDENSAGRMLTNADMPALDGDISALYFGGISLACEPAADAYATLAQTQGVDRLVMIDPNIRPSFIVDEDRFRARIARMIAVADIVKVSDEDLIWLEGDTLPLADTARALLERGPSLVIVTEGAQGATAYLPDGKTAHAASHKVDVVDTVGAGDTFNAGVLAKLAALDLLDKITIGKLSTDAAQQALAHGNAVAAVTVSRAGANPPWASEL